MADFCNSGFFCSFLHACITHSNPTQNTDGTGFTHLGSNRIFCHSNRSLCPGVKATGQRRFHRSATRQQQDCATNNNNFFHCIFYLPPPVPCGKIIKIKKVWELYLLYPKVWLLALPMVRIKQQQPTPIGYNFSLHGACVYQKMRVLLLLSSYHFKFCENLTFEDNINNTFTLKKFLPQRLHRYGLAEL